MPYTIPALISEARFLMAVSAACSFAATMFSILPEPEKDTVKTPLFLSSLTFPSGEVRKNLAFIITWYSDATPSFSARG